MTRIPFRRVTVSTASGSDPDSFDDKNSEAYMDNDHDEFGTVIVPCHRSPVGQCQYDNNGIRCMYCGRPNE